MRSDIDDVPMSKNDDPKLFLSCDSVNDAIRSLALFYCLDVEKVNDVFHSSWPDFWTKDLIPDEFRDERWAWCLEQYLNSKCPRRDIESVFIIVVVSTETQVGLKMDYSIIMMAPFHFLKNSGVLKDGLVALKWWSLLRLAIFMGEIFARTCTVLMHSTYSIMPNWLAGMA